MKTEERRAYEKRWHAEHPDRVRGLLHRGCNNAVGAYENLRKQIEAYLKVN